MRCAYDGPHEPQAEARSPLSFGPERISRRAVGAASSGQAVYEPEGDVSAQRLRGAFFQDAKSGSGYAGRDAHERGDEARGM
jgi:hypothetical protein